MDHGQHWEKGAWESLAMEVQGYEAKSLSDGSILLVPNYTGDDEVFCVQDRLLIEVMISELIQGKLNDARGE